jgi:hypothetical protein
MKIIRPETSAIQDMNHKRFIEDLYKLSNRGISFGRAVQYHNNTQVDPNADQNIEGVSAEIANTGAANILFAVTHNLGRVPLFYDVKYMSDATIIYDSGTAWTKTQIFLKSTTANVKIRLWIH